MMTFIGAGLLLNLAITPAHAAPTQTGVSSTLAGHGNRLRDVEREVQEHKARIIALEAEVAKDCQTTSNACDATVAELRREHEALAVTVGQLDSSLKAVQVYLYGVGGTSAAPMSGSLAAWQQDAEARLKDHEQRIARLETQVASNTKRLDVIEVAIYGNVDEDGDGLSDGMIQETDGNGDVYYVPSLSEQTTRNADAIADVDDRLWLGIGAEVAMRKSWSDSDDQYDVPGSSGSLGLSWLYVNGQAMGQPLGLYGDLMYMPGRQSGMSVTAAPVVLGESSDSHFGWGLGLGGRFSVLGSLDGSAFAYRQSAVVAPVLLMVSISDRARVVLDLTPAMGFEEGRFVDGIYGSSSMGLSFQVTTF